MVIGPGAGLVVVLAAPSGIAQTPPSPEPGLDLARVVLTTLSSSPDVQLAALRAEASRGALLAAGATFDFQLESSGVAKRNHAADPVSGAEAIQSDLAYAVGTERLFRSGMAVRTSVGFARRGYSTVPGSATSNSVDVGLTLTVPLLRDRGGAVSQAAERAAAREQSGSSFGLSHATAQRVLSSVSAYWDYLAVWQRLEVLRSSEERAQRMVEETRVLVQADERTSADLTQLLGNLASKRVARIAAEQDVVEARRQLGLAMGLPADAIAALPAPATDFPRLAREPITRLPTERLIENAYAHRPDLAAAEHAVGSARVLLDASRNELRPRLDLVVGTGYTAVEPGLGFGSFFSPLYRHDPRLDASVQLSYRFPARNSGARGRLLQVSALHEQQRVIQDDLRRRVATGVAVAVEALVRGDAGTREAEQAVTLFEAGVLAEQRKFQLGVSTLFDMILAQDALTNALLARIQSRRAYAVAVATLRFESGTLLDGDTVALDGLQAPP